MAGPLVVTGGSESAMLPQLVQERLLGAIRAGREGEIVVLPTAAAYEQPEQAGQRIAAVFEGVDRAVTVLDVLTRGDALQAELADRVCRAAAIVLVDGSPLHLRSVLKETPLWNAIEDAWNHGAMLFGAGEVSTVLGDPMIDPRGGALTLGLGLVADLTFAPISPLWTSDLTRRVRRLSTGTSVLIEIPHDVALVRWSDGSWEEIGGSVAVVRNEAVADILALPVVTAVGG